MAIALAMVSYVLFYPSGARSQATVQGSWLQSNKLDLSQWPPNIVEVAPVYDRQSNTASLRSKLAVCRFTYYDKKNNKFYYIPGFVWVSLGPNNKIIPSSCAGNYEGLNVQSIVDTYELLVPGSYHWGGKDEKSHVIQGGGIYPDEGSKVYAICRVPGPQNPAIRAPDDYNMMAGAYYNNNCFYNSQLKSLDENNIQLLYGN
ncbi:hypothetical protein [Paraburkholderia silvatlantica]|uniref:hypothetical protein n=1 Tax=Paraburkholderia silvatlantica TaxID=321895 RepID=UPI0037512083